MCVFANQDTLAPRARPGCLWSLPGLAAPATALFVFLDDQDPFLAEQNDVFVAEHASSAASVADCR